MLTLALRCWLLVAVLLAGLGTPWWVQAGSMPAVETAQSEGCHESSGTDQERPLPHRHDGSCDGLLCDCGCVLPPLLLAARAIPPAILLAPDPSREQTVDTPLSPVGAPFRPPIG